MVDRILFIIRSLEEFLSLLHLVIDKVMNIFRIAVKFGENLYDVSFIYEL
jgi:hypothetical protein